MLSVDGGCSIDGLDSLVGGVCSLQLVGSVGDFGVGVLYVGLGMVSACCDRVVYSITRLIACWLAMTNALSLSNIPSIGSVVVGGQVHSISSWFWISSMVGAGQDSSCGG